MDKPKWFVGQRVWWNPGALYQDPLQRRFGFAQWIRVVSIRDGGPYFVQSVGCHEGSSEGWYVDKVVDRALMTPETDAQITAREATEANLAKVCARQTVEFMGAKFGEAVDRTKIMAAS